MGIRIVVANQKGGTGKTTSTIILSYLLSKAGLKVLAVDFDPQACLTTSLGLKADNGVAEALEMLIREYDAKRVEDVNPGELVDAKDYVVVAKFLDGNFDVLPSSKDLGVVERRLNETFEGERMLSWLLDGLNYDVTIIDTKPSIDALLRNALVAGDYVLVPVDLRTLGLVGFVELVGVVMSAKRSYNSKLKWLGVLPTRFGRYKEEMANLEKLREKVQDKIKIYDPVPNSVAVERMFHVESLEELFRAVKTAKDVFKAYERVAEDVKALVG